MVPAESCSRNNRLFLIQFTVVSYWHFSYRRTGIFFYWFDSNGSNLNRGGELSTPSFIRESLRLLLTSRQSIYDRHCAAAKTTTTEPAVAERTKGTEKKVLAGATINQVFNFFGDLFLSRRSATSRSLCPQTILIESTEAPALHESALTPGSLFLTILEAVAISPYFPTPTISFDAKRSRFVLINQLVHRRLFYSFNHHQSTPPNRLTIMPIFRIMGGNSSNSAARSTNLTSSATRAAPQQNQQPQQQQQRVSRHTYPGMRISHGPGGAAGAPLGGGMPMPPPRVGGVSPNTSVNSAMLHSSMPGGVVVRGSSVGGSGGAAPPVSAPLPPAQNPAMSSGTGGIDSSVSTVPGAAAGGVGTTNRPGAYSVTRTTVGPAQIYRVTVPPGVRPGAEFTVHAGQRRVRVRCPPTSRPGHSLQITLPPEPTTHNNLLRVAPVTNPYSDTSQGGAMAMTPEVKRVNQAASESGGTAQTFLVTIPPDVYPGMQFTVNVEGQRFMVTCPSNAGPNMKVRIVPPTQREEPLAAPKTQVFEVKVPPGVRPSQPFTLMANGQRVLVTCPPNVVPGQKIHFQLPVQHALGSIQLSYESEKDGGWCRTIRVNDLKFQWVRTTANTSRNDLDINGGGISALDDMQTFDFSKAAYVRKLQMLEGNDARMRTGKVTLVPAQEAVVESRLVQNGKTILSYSDIANYQTKSLEIKSNWFYGTVCSQITAPWEDGHVKIVVRRRHLLNDSVDAIMSLGREDMRKRWRIEFLGEPGIDAGGVTREWFQLVTEMIFDPDFGLWLSSVNNQMCMIINPASGKYLGEGVVQFVRGIVMTLNHLLTRPSFYCDNSLFPLILDCRYGMPRRSLGLFSIPRPCPRPSTF